jgi:hypothetical protein
MGRSRIYLEVEMSKEKTIYDALRFLDKANWYFIHAKRVLDDLELDTLYCELDSAQGEMLAVYNKLYAKLKGD